MDIKIKKVLDEIETVCKNNNVMHLYLFGSYARGTNTLGSDLDIVVKGVENQNKLKEDLDNIRTLISINLFNYDKIRNKYLLEDINTYAKIIY